MFTTREVVLVAPGKVEIREREIEPGLGQVVLKVEACGVCAWEARHVYRNGELPYPRALGHEACGIVVGVGPDVKAFSVGDKVTGLFQPGFATYTVADANLLVKIPADLDLELAIAEPVKCVVTSLRAAPVEPGDVVAVVGCGFMGLLVACALASNRFTRVICIDVNESRVAFTRKLGIQDAVLANSPELDAVVKRLTHGRGVDLVFETSGVPSGFDTAVSILKKGRGRMVFVSYPNSRNGYQLTTACDQSCVISFTHPSFSTNPMDDLERAVRGLEARIFDMGRLITHRFPLSKAAEAMDLCLDPPPGFIKAIVKPWL